MENDVSLFEFNPDSGQLEYVPTEEELREESGSNESGVLAAEDSTEGSILSGEEVLEEDSSVLSGSNGIPGSSDGDSDSVLDSVQVMQVLLANSPASGSLSSSTIDYFDRLVSSLPSDFKYVAYRNDSEDSYAGTIIYGDDYDVSGNTVVFGEGAKGVDVSRYSGSGYQNYISYDTYDATDTTLSLTDSGTILYYTNAIEGYPVLGNYYRPVGFSSVIVAALLAAFASCVLGKLFNRNRG